MHLEEAALAEFLQTTGSPEAEKELELKVFQLMALLVLAGLLVFPIPGFGDAEARTGCTITVQPGQPMQKAIDQAPEGAVVCVPAGEWSESIKISKSLTLRGAGPEVTKLGGLGNNPVITVDSPSSLDVKIEDLSIVEGKGRYKGDGIKAKGRVTLTISNCSILNNMCSGIQLEDSAQAIVTRCRISGSKKPRSRAARH